MESSMTSPERKTTTSPHHGLKLDFIPVPGVGAFESPQRGKKRRREGEEPQSDSPLSPRTKLRRDMASEEEELTEIYRKRSLSGDNLPPIDTVFKPIHSPKSTPSTPPAQLLAPIVIPASAAAAFKALAAVPPKSLNTKSLK
ncbi:unnamed protein product [Phaeothamnion confervicola]